MMHMRTIARRNLYFERNPSRRLTVLGSIFWPGTLTPLGAPGPRIGLGLLIAVISLLLRNINLAVDFTAL